MKIIFKYLKNLQNKTIIYKKKKKKKLFKLKLKQKKKNLKVNIKLCFYI